MVALAQMVAWAALCGTPCQIVKLDLPAGTMFDQVRDIALQAGLEWVFRYPDINPRAPVPALRGTFTVNDALRRVLERTPYTFEFEGSDFFWIEPIQRCGVLGWRRKFPVPPCFRGAQE